MKRLSICSLILVSTVTQAQFTDTKPKSIVVPEGCVTAANQYIVQTPKTVSTPNSPNTLSVSDFANDLIANYGGVIDAVFADANSTYGGFSIKSLSLASAESMLKNESDVLGLEQVCYITAASSQSNPGWALDRLDQTNLPLDQSFDVPNYTGNSTHVYVVDQAIRGYFPGTNLIHSDLMSAKSPDNFPGDHIHFGAGIPASINKNSLPCTIHGTAVAGNIAGSRTGIARNSILHSYAAFDCQSPAMTDTAITTRAFRRILAEHPSNYPNERAVINFSALSVSSPALEQAIKDLATQNIITVVAMGNNSQNRCSGIPQLDETIAVGASGSSNLSGDMPSTIDIRWVDSSTNGSNYGACTDIYAPGSNVATTAAASPTSLSTESGTSFATPLVTGAVAVYLEQNPNASLSSVVTAIKSNALVNQIANVPVGDNDLLNICFLNGSCAPTPPTCTNDQYEQNDSYSAASSYSLPVDSSGNTTGLHIVSDSGWRNHNFCDDSEDWTEVRNIDSAIGSDNYYHFVAAYFKTLDTNINGTSDEPICIVRRLSDTSNVSATCDDNDPGDDPHPAGQLVKTFTAKTSFQSQAPHNSVFFQYHPGNGVTITGAETDYQMRLVHYKCRVEDLPCNAPDLF